MQTVSARNILLGAGIEFLFTDCWENLKKVDRWKENLAPVDQGQCAQKKMKTLWKNLSVPKRTALEATCPHVRFRSTQVSVEHRSEEWSTVKV